MSAYGMKPLFTNKEGYLQWCREWKIIYARISEEIKRDKQTLSALMQNRLKKEYHYEAGFIEKFQKELVLKRVMAFKVMSLLEEAKLRRNRIIKMQEDLALQNAMFPMELKDCRNIDFHFNKGSLEYNFLPMWVIKTKGMSFYVNHIDAQIPWSTKEMPEGSSTRGMIRLKYGNIVIDETGTATIHSSDERASGVKSALFKKISRF